MNDARVPGGRARDGAEAGRVLATRSRRTRRSSSASRRSTTRARRRSSRPSSSGWPGCTTRTSCARARSSTRRPRSALAEINQQLAALYTTFSQNVLADEDDHVLVLDKRGRSRRPARVAARGARRPRPRRKGMHGQVGRSPTRARRVEPFLTYSTRRDLREKVWRMFVNRGDNGDAHDNNADHHRDPAAARRAREAARLSRRTRTGALENAMAKTPERAMAADGGGVEAGGRARAARKSPTCRRSPTRRGAKHQDRAVGLPLLRREGAQGEVRPRPERGQAVPAARQAARGDVLGGGPALRLRVHAGQRTCPSTTRRARLGGDGQATASTSASGTSIPTRAPASARARG